MSLYEELASDLQEEHTERGTARLWTLAPTVYVTCVTGYLEDRHAALFEVYGTERIRQANGQRLYVLHDWLDMTGYESRCRQRMTSWSVARLSAYAEVHLAVRSKLVAMGVEVANLALRGLIRAHTNRLRLETELTRILRSVPGAPRIA